MSKDNITARHILSEIDAAIRKSSDGTDHLPDDRYVNQILFLVSNSPGSITFLARRLSEILETSRDFPRSIKLLVLLHRLLRGGDRFFEQDMRLLWSSGDLRISPQPYGATFVMNYSLFLQERIEWLINQAGKLEPVRTGDLDSNDCGDKSVELVIYNASKCQVFFDRAMACLPENLTMQQNQLIIFVLNIIVRESLRVYESFYEGFEIVVASFFYLKRPSRISALGIMRKAIWQTPKLQEFYDFCKRVITGKKIDFPSIRIITEEDISSMEQFADAKEEEKQMKMTNAQEENQEVQAFEKEWSYPFSGKLETTISTVWVEFSEGEDDLPTEGESSENYKSMVLF
ncbi:putative clathrin assembly protein At1g33340 [Phalaenopsis equestris]|uniref:putative clathrin assembly protein At1g33340 n=1 Tax=Phalaenopsis equestris TaxID=78828 RepID=UPI0009E2924B|nr:putative clathrin assembly protein At1g33340 [Phalaenopsis equestris]